MSPLPGRVEDGLWTGALSDLGGLTGVDELCLACERLRFTGRLRLLASDGELLLEAQWAGGEVAEVEDAADEATLMSFMPPPGTLFEVVQGMPGLDGVLVDQRELAGALTPGLVQRLYELCAKARLSARVVLRGGPPESPPAGAEFRFIQGRVTTATIAGEEQAALPALAALSTWTAGEFFVHVDPCFEAPPSSASLHGAPPGSALSTGGSQRQPDEPGERRASIAPSSRRSTREFDVTGVVPAGAMPTGRVASAESSRGAVPTAAPRVVTGAITLDPMAPGRTRTATGSHPIITGTLPSARTPVSGVAPRLPGLTQELGEPRVASGTPRSSESASTAAGLFVSPAPETTKPETTKPDTKVEAKTSAPTTVVPLHARETERRPPPPPRPRRDGVSASGGGPAAQLARQVRLPSAAASAASAAPVVSAPSPAGPWIRAAVTGVVLGALAFLLFLGVRGRTPAGPSQGGPRASLSSGESR